MVLISVIIIYILGVIYTRWMNKFLYELNGCEIIPYAWFVPILGPITITVQFFMDYGGEHMKKLKSEFKFLDEFLGGNWKRK